jgi:hypothetical protein
VPQISGKASDGEIGNGVKLIKRDAEMFFELAFIIRLQLRLRPWQKRAHRIVNEMKR